jgi:hypothetical protein
MGQRHGHEPGAGAAQVLFGPQALGERGAGTVYVLQGRVKLNGAPGAGAKVLTPFFDAADLGGVIVMAVDTAQAEVFAEAGDVSLRLDRDRREPLSSGEFVRLRHDSKLVLSNRPTASFIQGLPKVFLESLPLRATAGVLTQAPKAKPLGPLTYADLQPWLNANPALRRAYLPHWRPLARDANFRAGLLSEMTRHPEWAAVLVPPKRNDGDATPRALTHGTAP